MGIPLRIAEPAGIWERSLRRYRPTAAGECPANGYGYCDASTVIGEVTGQEPHGDNWPHDDPRWPLACARCGTPFTEADQWQRNDDPVCVLPDGSRFTFRGAFGRCAPAGAMIRAPWYDGLERMPGEAWLVALPDGGEWITTQPATGGGYWTVAGTPPDITVTPSIWHHPPDGWHGWIRSGELTDA